MKSALKILAGFLLVIGLNVVAYTDWERPRFPASLYSTIDPTRFYFKLEPWDTAGYEFYLRSPEAISATLSLRRIKERCHDDGFCIITTKEGGLVVVIIDDEPPSAIGTMTIQEYDSIMGRRDSLKEKK